MNLKFVVVLRKHEEKDGVYSLFDFFKYECMVAYEDEKGDKHQTSQYSILSIDNLLEANNLRVDVLLPSFKRIKNRVNFDKENWFMLRLLSAYDKSKGKRKDLLDVAYDFAVWIKEDSEDIDDIIKELNYLQVIKRQRQLNDVEIQKLWHMAVDDNLSFVNKLAVYLLLDQHIPAEKCYAKLSLEEQEYFKELPIYNFLKKENEK